MGPGGDSWSLALVFENFFESLEFEVINGNAALCIIAKEGGIDVAEEVILSYEVFGLMIERDEGAQFVGREQGFGFGVDFGGTTFAGNVNTGF
jgi:hypothetical protein